MRQLLLDVADYIEIETKGARPQLRFAGGWVRDKLLGYASQDIDIAVDNMTGLRFAEHMREFAGTSNKAKQYGGDIVKKITKIAARPEQSKHLETATLTVFDLSIDITNLRKEVYDDVTRNPQMEFGTAEEDALRRDATINALFYNLQDENVEDLTKQGLVDMEDNLIRTPLDPFQTFKDDPLRILRCIRFASRLEYKIENSVVQAMAIPEIREALRVKITRERIGVEMEKIFKGKCIVLPEMIGSDWNHTGPRVLQALRYIEDANLYPIVFSNPKWKETRPVDLTGWRSAYERVAEFIESNDNKLLCDLRNWLIVTKEEQQITWIIAALVPYSVIVYKDDYQLNKKNPKTLPALVSREGLKVDNKIRDIIDASFSRIHEIVGLKNDLQIKSSLSGSASDGIHEKSRAPVSREEVGMMFNDWGISWKASIIAAMISELMAKTDRSKSIQILFCPIADA